MTTFTEQDHGDLARLVGRFFRSLDERHFDEDWARAFFTDDIRGRSPVGGSRGRPAMLRQTAEAVGRFDRTQHMATDVLTDPAPDGRTATVTWNALMTHVHRDTTLKTRGPDADPVFTVGGHWRATVRRTPDGWRFQETSVDAVWTRGEPPLLGPAADGRREPPDGRPDPARR
ncbi:nuclear transport factor 2 family protein [Streptomyces sp. NPDC093509]|uniref:nuclear transport factor 2 family protein n=1 Tax=Streptomyces sp. NPDC093509 TaxID=3154982 RepID=UPI00344EA3B9